MVKTLLQRVNTESRTRFNLNSTHEIISCRVTVGTFVHSVPGTIKNQFSSIKKLAIPDADFGLLSAEFNLLLSHKSN